MSTLTENVNRNINKLVPSSDSNEIACFVFYDNHPRDSVKLDITICTVKGILKEYYKREELFSIPVNISKPIEIRILRNCKGELFYLVAGENDLVIISRKDKLHIHQEVTNVDYYDISDTGCRGQACLKIVRKDDAVPLVYDDNFENLGEIGLMLQSIHAADSEEIITQLQRKLTEAKYSVKCNEKTLKDFLNLRQVSAFYSYQKIRPNLTDSIYKLKQSLTDSLKIKTQAPFVILCNQKVVVVLNIYNKNTIPAEDVHMLLHTSIRTSIVHTTKLFEKTATSVFWSEKETNSIRTNIETAVVAVIDQEELKHDVTGRINFNGVLFFKKDGIEYMLPFDDVFISATDYMGDNYDILAGGRIGEPNNTLAIQAATEKRKLCLTHIKNFGDSDLNLQKVFCKHLQMEQVPNIHNAVIHRNSTYHKLNGLVIVFEDNTQHNINVSVFHVTIYSRMTSQLINLIHSIHQFVPYKIIVTTPNHRIVSKMEKISIHDEENSKQVNCEGYATSILRQSSMILEYFDSCNVKMNESKDPATRNKIGFEIDLFAGGIDTYLAFKEKMLNEASGGIKSVHAFRENT